MQYGNLPGIEKPIARLVQGTVMIGSDHLDESFALLDAIYALGGNAFDTAHVYGSGDTERTLGRWVNERGIRDEVVIVTKGAHHNADRNCVTPFDITAHLHDSLARLKTDYIDLYLLHRDDPSVPVGPIVERLNQHLEEGLIHAFGGSNWAYKRIKAANEYAETHGLTPFVVSSPQFSLAEMVEPPWPNCVSIGGPSGEAAREYYRESQIALFTWSSLAGGFFSGRFTPNNLDSFTSGLDALCVRSYCYPENFERLNRAKQLAEAKGLALPQIALSYVLSQPLNVFALVGCRAPEEFEQNIAAMQIALTPEEIAWLELNREELPQ